MDFQKLTDLEYSSSTGVFQFCDVVRGCRIVEQVAISRRKSPAELVLSRF